MPQSFSVRLDSGALDALLDGLVEDLTAAARPAAQAGAQVLYDAVKRNVAALGRKSGNLDASIYQVYSKSASQGGEQVYHISWNASKAPHGHLVEFGYTQRFARYLGKDGDWHTDKTKLLANPVRVPAHPFVRPAISLFPEVQDAMEAELLSRIGGKK